MFSSLKYNFKDYDLKSSFPAVQFNSVPTKKQIYQSRKNFGVNFGSVFILEKYIFDSLFIDDSTVELDAIKNQVKANGVAKTRESLENHWKNYATDDDWNWLKSTGVTSIRIPIGYWELNQGEFCKNTPFEGVAEVYTNAWEIFKEYYIKKANSYNISVLVDLHGLPGGANTGDHSGQLLDYPEFWDSSKYQTIALNSVKFIAEDLKSFENISGIQIVNESVYDESGARQIKYYKAAIHKIRKIDQEIPIVISDGWNPNQWIDWIENSERSVNGDLGVILDVHIYRCFDDKDKSKNPDEIIRDLESTIVPDLKGRADVLVGEYSGVLDGQTWDKFHGDRNEKVVEFLNTQVRIFNHRCSGSYFWTFKFQYGDGGEWGFVPMVNSGALPRRINKVENFPSAEKRDEILNEQFNNHANYWNNANPNENYEHERYKDGFLTGWNDAAEFAKFDGSTIGRKHSWKLARKNDHIKIKGNSNMIWEWEQGFDAGLGLFEKAAGLV